MEARFYQSKERYFDEKKIENISFRTCMTISVGIKRPGVKKRLISCWFSEFNQNRKSHFSKIGDKKCHKIYQMPVIWIYSLFLLFLGEIFKNLKVILKSI